MKLSMAIGLVALQLSSAHTVFAILFINDVDQGDGACVRMPMTPSNATFPVIGAPLSVETACGNGGSVYVNRTCPVPSGAKLTFTFREILNNATAGSLDASHLGPCAVYMKYVESPMIPGNGDSWFKIWDEGYDTTASKWCTEKLIDNNGLLSVKVPEGLPGGYYLVRTELIALQDADKIPPDPQFYIGCAQIFLSSPNNGTDGLLPKTTVSIPGYLAATDPTILFNIYTNKGAYVMPGPMPYSALQSAATSVPNVMNQDYGLLPSNAIATNANWWASEMDPYSTSDGCWNASESCFSQLTTCYATAPPTGDTGCRLWEQKCDGIQSACNASTFTGPPNAGKSLIILESSPYAIPDAANLTVESYLAQYNGTEASGDPISITILPSTDPQATHRSIPSAASRLSTSLSSTTFLSKLPARTVQYLNRLVQKPRVIERRNPPSDRRLLNVNTSSIDNVTITIINDNTTPIMVLSSSPTIVSSITPSNAWQVFMTTSTPGLITSVGTSHTIGTISASKTTLNTSVEHTISASTTTSVIRVTVTSTWTSWINFSPSTSESLRGSLFVASLSTDPPSKSTSLKSRIIATSLSSDPHSVSLTPATSKSVSGSAILAPSSTILQSVTATSVVASSTSASVPNQNFGAPLLSNLPMVSFATTISSATSRLPAATDAITITIVPGTDHEATLQSIASTTSTVSHSSKTGTARLAVRTVEYLKRSMPKLKVPERHICRTKRGRKHWR